MALKPRQKQTVAPPAVTTATLDSATEALAPTQITLENLEALASSNPAEALRFLELQEKLESHAKKQEERRQNANFQINMLKSIEDSMRQKANAQAGCERRGHVRQDNSLALGAQKDSKGIIHAVCTQCQKVWDQGIGDGPGQIPPHIVNRMNSELIGG